MLERSVSFLSNEDEGSDFILPLNVASQWPGDCGRLISVESRSKTSSPAFGGRGETLHVVQVLMCDLAFYLN